MNATTIYYRSAYDNDNHFHLELYMIMIIIVNFKIFKIKNVYSADMNR
jgi:hypothetical protein